MEIHSLAEQDRTWAVQLVVEQWGVEIVVSRGTVHHVHTLPGLIAVHNGQKAGLLTYTISGEQCEIVTINTLLPSVGVGTALIEEVKSIAERAGCRRLWLITTNDNLHALGFYQQRGFVLAALHRNAIERSRQLKPSIPLIGFDGIPIRDELELEMALDA